MESDQSVSQLHLYLRRVESGVSIRHGFLQCKDQFVAGECYSLEDYTEREILPHMLHSWYDENIIMTRVKKLREGERVFCMLFLMCDLCFYF